jgi:5-methyltetrahydrofolate--homocysteine methyltransferase
MRDTFMYIGERCNVAGSIMYKKAIVDGNYEKAAAIARKQVRGSPTPAAAYFSRH